MARKMVQRVNETSAAGRTRLALTMTTGNSENERRLHYLLPTFGYIFAQLLILFALVAASLSPRDVAMSGIGTQENLVNFGGAFIFTFFSTILPALAVGATDGFFRSVRSARWHVIARVGSLMLILLLGIWIAAVGYVIASAIPLLPAYSPVPAQDLPPVSFSLYLGSLAGMEIALFISWGLAALIERSSEQRRSGEA